MRRFAIVLVSTLLVAGLAQSAFAEEHEDDGADAPGQVAKVEMLADFVAGQSAGEGEEPLPEDVDAAATAIADLREMEIGWGALFKLYKYSAITGMSIDELMAMVDEDGEISFGAIRKLAESEEFAEAFAAYDGPKNFGQLNKASKMAEKEARKAAKAAERAARKGG